MLLSVGKVLPSQTTNNGALSWSLVEAALVRQTGKGFQKQGEGGPHDKCLPCFTRFQSNNNNYKKKKKNANNNNNEKKP